MDTTEKIEALRRILAQEEDNLLLIEEQMSKYVMDFDIPLDLIKQARTSRKRIADLKRRIIELAQSLPEPAPASRGASGVFRCPGDTTGAAYVGSLNRKRFHRLTCRYAGPDTLYFENRICFKSRQAAINYGRTPCGVCRP